METKTGARVGYLRVSSVGQNVERQLADVALDKIFTEKISAKNSDRPQLQALLEYIREGDELFCHSLDRLARNLADLQSLVDKLTEKGVTVHFLKENLHFHAKGANPMDKLTLQLLGAFAEFERTLIAERRREGTALAKAQGKRLGRREKLSPEQKTELRAEASRGEDKTELAKRYGISRRTVYSVIQETPA